VSAADAGMDRRTAMDSRAFSRAWDAAVGTSQAAVGEAVFRAVEQGNGAAGFQDIAAHLGSSSPFLAALLAEAASKGVIAVDGGTVSIALTFDFSGIVYGARRIDARTTPSTGFVLETWSIYRVGMPSDPLVQVQFFQHDGAWRLWIGNVLRASLSDLAAVLAMARNASTIPTSRR
jgi:hypothetical protein